MLNGCILDEIIPPATIDYDKSDYLRTIRIIIKLKNGMQY
ncbi:MAG: hypothetical protein ACJAZP_000173 [Psychromonas sp.]|jgi:hypothetical protein